MRVSSANRVVAQSSRRAEPRLNVHFAEDQRIAIPDWVVDLQSFRRWTTSDEFPDSGRIDFIKDTIWVDMTMEEFYTHNQVKLAFLQTVGPIVESHNSGYLIPDRMGITNTRIGLSGEPDAAFSSYQTIRSKRLRMVRGKRGVTELTGTPDMVLEVVSHSSIGKDTKVLFEMYESSGVPEYWLIDVRGKAIRFEICCHVDGVYAATTKTDGWIRSIVFAHEFRVTKTKNPLGKPRFALEARA
jgi:Uma2 family endonuclease